jgi:hypothetical protein
MSFLIGQSKKQMTNINSKNIEERKKPLSQRAYFQKLFLNKYQYDLNYPNIGANYKGNKKLTSKYNTLKNSRKKKYYNINFINY